MSNGYPGPQGRQRAVALGAADARTLIRSALRVVASTMTDAQIGQVQKVLDAAVVNPALEKEYDELMRRSIVNPALVQDYERMARYSAEQSRPYRTKGRDPNIVRRADKVLQERIEISQADKHVKLDFGKLLTQDALVPTSDNPDEKHFLIKIRHVLVSNGVWLRFEPQLVRSPEDPSRWIVDQRTFQAWLTVGYNGTPIPTQDGRLTREALVDGAFGAGYYREVITGKVQSALDNAIKLVTTEVNHWKQVHWQQDSARTTAAPGVVFVSDHLGGADYPSQKIWDLPQKLLARARSENKSGKLKQAGKTIVVAALATQSSAKRLNRYIDDEMKGAGRAVKALTVATKAGKIAGDVLIIMGAYGALTELMTAEGVEAGLDVAGQRALPPGAPPPRALPPGPPPPRALPPGPPPPRLLPPGNPNPNYYRGGPAVYANTENGVRFAQTEQALNRAAGEVAGQQTGASVADIVRADREREAFRFRDLPRDVQQQITSWIDEFERLATAGQGGDYYLSTEEVYRIHEIVTELWGSPDLG